jgi:transcriptional regulator with XRE-family HTH domain
METKFTERFVEAIQTAQITQNKIAELAGVTRQTVSDFKRGRSVPSIHTLVKLCRILDVSADYLLGLADY